MEKVVKSSVADSVKEEFKSYSSVVSTPQPTAPVICQKALTSVVKSLVEEEDRSRNFLVFGLPEEEEAQVGSTANRQEEICWCCSPGESLCI